MTIDNDTKKPIAPLSEDFYNLAEDEKAFFEVQTGIQNKEELKKHILEIQRASYAVYPYPCIRRFHFTSLKISRLPAYPHLLELGKKRPGAVLLDFGCCFGNDIRKAIADGWPMENAVATDLRRGFWDLGHELFKSTPETFPVPFIAGDIFDPAHIAPAPPFYEPPTTPRPDFSSLTSLTPLQGHVSAIHCSAFFHLFMEEQQLQAARALASLLSPEPGSMIFGEHGGLLQKGLRTRHDTLAKDPEMFCHSPESWKELWETVVFKSGAVRVDVDIVELEINRRKGVASDAMHRIRWCVMRL